MHKMQTIVTVVCCVCLSVCLSLSLSVTNEPSDCSLFSLCGVIQCSLITCSDLCYVYVVLMPWIIDNMCRT